MTWSAWKRIDQPAQYKGCAVYRIRLAKDQEAARIPRFLGVDTDGLLCIGQTGNFERRRKQFVRGSTRGRGHSPANLLHILKTKTHIRSVYSSHEVEYSFRQCENKEDAGTLEATLIKAYIMRFGEPPPLNSAIPGRRESEGWV